MYNKKELKAGPLTHKKSNPFGKDVDYIPFDGQSQYMYLTDEEIAAYKAGGYVVEEDGGDIYFPPKSNPANDFAVTDPRSMAKGGELDMYPKGGGTGKNKKGNSKNVQSFVTSDPDEYAYRKAAYNDSLWLHQNNLKPVSIKSTVGYGGKNEKLRNLEVIAARNSATDLGAIFDKHKKYSKRFVDMGKEKHKSPYSNEVQLQAEKLGIDHPITKYDHLDYVIGRYRDNVLMNPITNNPITSFDNPFENDVNRQWIINTAARYKKPVQPVLFQAKPAVAKKPKVTQQKPVDKLEVIEPTPTPIPQPIPTPVIVNPELPKFVEEQKPEPPGPPPPRPGTDVMPVYNTDELPMYATPDPDAEWVGNTERYVDWDGNKIPYRLPKFRKPGHSGDLVKPGKRRYIPIPSIETRYQAEIVPEEQFKNGGALNIPWYKYAGNTYTHYNMGGNTDPGNNALELHMFYDKDVFKDGGEPRPKEIGPTYYYPGRTGSEYKLNDSGQWTIKNSSTNGKFVPIKDPNGTRSAELDRHALDSGEFAEYQKNLKYQIENPKAPQMYIKDTRTVRATSGNPINPNVDLKSSNYNQDVITNIIKRAKAYGVDPATAVAVGLQESMLGKTDTNIGHMLHGDPNDPYAYIPFLKQSMDRGKNNLGYNDVYRQLQVYNGLGVITPQTEKKYHGYSMGKIYGVPIPAGGINMKQNPLYGKEIMDIRNNVLMKNPQFVKLLKQTKARRFDEGGSYYEDELTNDEIQALRAAGYQVDEL